MHQHDVDTKRLVGQRTAVADVFPQGIGIHTAGTDQAQRPGIRAGSGKFARGDIGHSTLDNGIFRT